MTRRPRERRFRMVTNPGLCPRVERLGDEPSSVAEVVEAEVLAVKIDEGDADDADAEHNVVDVDAGVESVEADDADSVVLASRRARVGSVTR